VSDARGAQAAAPLPCRGSEHLSHVTHEVDVLATEVRELLALAQQASLAALDTLRTATRTDTLEATLFLDGAGRGRSRPHGDAGGEERVGTWADALEHSPGIGFDAPDEREAAEIERLSALERDGVRAALASTDLVPAFSAGSSDPAALGGAIIALHARLSAGLVADERIGALRRGPRIVHDSSIGRIIHFPTEPQHLDAAWEGLLRSLAAHGSPLARSSSAVRSGVLHLELLRHHPFDAANGRLARCAARLVLAADELIDDVVSPEVVLAEDPLGYLDGVAASTRRGDATAWVERWVESIGEALLRARATLRTLLPALPAIRISGALDGLIVDTPTEALTIADLAQHLGVGSVEARARASTLVVAGELRRVIGSGGLRLTRG